MKKITLYFELFFKLIFYELFLISLLFLGKIWNAPSHGTAIVVDRNPELDAPYMIVTANEA